MSKNRFKSERFSLRGARNRYRRQSTDGKHANPPLILLQILKIIRIEGDCDVSVFVSFLRLLIPTEPVSRLSITEINPMRTMTTLNRCNKIYTATTFGPIILKAEQSLRRGESWNPTIPADPFGESKVRERERNKLHDFY